MIRPHPHVSMIPGIELTEPTPQPEPTTPEGTSTGTESLPCSDNKWLRVPATPRRPCKGSNHRGSMNNGNTEHSIDESTGNQEAPGGQTQITKLATRLVSEETLRSHGPGSSSSIHTIVCTPSRTTTPPKHPNTLTDNEDPVDPKSLPVSSPITRLNNLKYLRQKSRLKIQRDKRHSLPARLDRQGSSRTIISIGGPNKFTLVRTSKDDAPILIQAGLELFLEQKSEKYGFTKDVILGVYKDMGSLRETEAALEAMKRSADEVRRNMLKNQIASSD